MTAHHISLYHSINNQPNDTVLKQELITYQQTAFGITITKLERSFSDGNHVDNYCSTPLLIRAMPKQQVVD